MTDQLTRKLSQIPVQHIPVDQIKTDGKNPNRMSDELFQGLIQHIRDNGILNPVIITEDMLLADGEHRLRAAKEIGLQTIPARIIPSDERLRRLIRQTMNKLRGQHDKDLDAEEYRALIDLEGINHLATYLGEDIGDLLKILDKAITPKQENPDDYDLEQALQQIPEPTTKPGDKIIMGDHILICGDATDPQTWTRLLDGQEPAIMITDPPYNVAYTGGTAKHLTIMNDNMPREKFRQFLLDFLTCAMQHIKGAQYIFMSSSEWTTLADAFEKAGGLWSTTIIWVKTHFVLSRKDFHPQYEPLFVGGAVKELQKHKAAKTSAQPIIYGWKKGSTRQHYDTRTESDVWVAEKPSRNEQHPTMKPVTLYRKAILLSSRPLDIVVDPFCGSGSCVIACEQTHRKARVLELDPIYCDVIVNRWEQFTGKKAERTHA